MFSAHLADISVKRSEPEDFNVEEKIKEIRKANAILAEKIVIEGWLKRKKPKNKKKLKRVIEFEERVKLTEDFMVIWDYWRDFYFELPPMKIKTAGQLTAIESIKEMCDREEIGLNLTIACAHKAYTWGDLRPGFTAVINKGLEWYIRYRGEVSDDLDRAEYQEDSLG